MSDSLRRFWNKDDNIQGAPDVSSKPSKEECRNDIASEVEQFLAKGGEITKVDIGATGKPMSYRAITALACAISKARLQDAD